MKKIIVLTILIFLSAPVCFANFFEQKWSEFCPVSMRKISPEKKYFLGTKKYWSERRKIFDERVKKCNTFSGDTKSDCFTELRNIETKATELRQGEILNATLYRMFTGY